MGTLREMAAKGPYPLPGAILPFYRIVAFWKSIFKRMGILGEYPAAEMLENLKGVSKLGKADSAFPVKPALHYIAVTAQTEGQNKNLRMPFHQIEKYFL
ncbi:MAG: hypothetical protein IPO72_10935 [Saprospiraceae bacterium]|nr:hypothetical protein [Candidatus Vicinibacter affinis]